MANNNFLEGSFKGANQILVTALLGVGGYLLYREWKKAQELKEANQAAEEADNELTTLAQQGIRPTYTTAQFESWCNILVQSMTGCGTDEDSIYAVMRYMKGKADVLALIKQFGVRYYQPCVYTSPVSYSIWLVNDQAYGGNLPTWFGYDLSDSNINEVNSILSQKGIDYKF
jgi:hypothetical protein